MRAGHGGRVHNQRHSAGLQTSETPVQKGRTPPANLTLSSDGRLLKSPEDVAEVWYKFLTDNFAATDRERNVRGPLEQLPSARLPSDSLTRAEFEKAVKKMPNAKAVGPLGVSIKAYKYCPELRSTLFDLINEMWESECVPACFSRAKFIILFKQKGSKDDPTKYRCIGLLNHEYKVLSQILLARLLVSSDGFLKDWQAGFRAL